MYRAPRGTADVLPEEQGYWRYIEARARALGQRFGYQRLDTPVFEQTALFVRGVGQGTDIVEKEMYSFLDRGGDSMTLRPEGTAPVCRAYLEHGMHNQPQPVRLYYFSPAFRYERPQAGRFRQHHQFGVEALGDGDPSVDAEIVEMAWRLMEDLGLRDLTLLLNSIGDSECRPAYLEHLRAYYASRVERLCQDCRGRLERSPLRLLDCKQEACQALAQEAPRSIDHLCHPCRDHWEELMKCLRRLDIPFRVEPRLVRGLDYYTRTVFEIQPPEERAQSTLCAGGRYDGLIQELGGPPTPGIGFAAGMERMVSNVKGQGVPVPQEESVRVVIAYLGDEAKGEALSLASQLRSKGIGAVLAPAGKSLRAQMRYANSLGVSYALILGEEEMRSGSALLRDMAKGEQRVVPLQGVAEELAN
ncbi:MAG: hisS [Dehalococcoidia bacterium]|nr:hisS [Dehalococcoidia bacterium]